MIERKVGQKLVIKVRGKSEQLTESVLSEIINLVEEVQQSWDKMSPSVWVTPFAAHTSETIKPILVSSLYELITKGEPNVKLHGQEFKISSLVPNLCLPGLESKIVQGSAFEESTLLGSGGYASVYLGTFKNHKVAVKKMLQDPLDGSGHWLTSPHFSDWRHEAMIHGALTHPNIVELEAISFDPPAFILELMTCGDFHGVLSDHENNVSWTYRLKVIADAARGLSYMHRRKPPIAHLDIKAMNIMLASKDENAPVLAKLADFGTSHIVPPSKLQRKYVDNPTWLAPELINQLPYDEKVDIYGLGCVIYEAGTGELMWHHIPWIAEIEDSIALGKTPPLSSTLFPSELLTLIGFCWEFDPVSRPTANFIAKQIGLILQKPDFAVRYQTIPKTKKNQNPSKPPQPDIEPEPIQLVPALQDLPQEPFVPVSVSVEKESPKDKDRLPKKQKSTLLPVVVPGVSRKHSEKSDSRPYFSKSSHDDPKNKKSKSSHSKRDKSTITEKK